MPLRINSAKREHRFKEKMPANTSQSYSESPSVDYTIGVCFVNQLQEASSAFYPSETYIIVFLNVDSDNAWPSMLII
jgi:hypothetical protein